jgi:DNA-binding IclR family transcriptional regulator
MKPEPAGSGMAREAGQGGVRSIVRAVALLRAFSAERPWLPLGELAARAALDKATARRILLTLAGQDLVVQDPGSGLYALGPRVLELGAAVPAMGDLRQAAGPVLARLAQATGTTTFLSVHRDGQAICVERFHGNQPVQVSWWQVGGALPINCGAAPRVLLAFMPEAESEALLRRPLPSLTSASRTDADALRAALQRIRKRGYEVAADDVAVGLAALGVPVRDRDGRVVAALSLGGLTPHIAPRGKPRFLAEALAAAAEIAARLA